MGFHRMVALAVVCAAGVLPGQHAPGGAPARIFNTVKQKLAEGKQVVGGTVSSPDPDVYCAMARSGFDFLWIEMQHSPLTYQEAARMIWACRGAPAIPFIRVPDATEGDIQKATDIGALGIIIPMVETMEKAEAAVRYSKYPPIGKRSQGGGQYGALWGGDYRAAANDNVMVVAMIESPAGAAIVDKLAALPGIDVIFVASTDLSSFSGRKQGDPEYESLVGAVRDATLKARLKLGGPLAWRKREGFTFFQGPGEGTLIRMGAQSALGVAPGPAGAREGIAPTEGQEAK
ncbi:MAG: hypothetical protein KIT09_32725 [Bryobacteraceae bacterium]|nr:hypothetical protein [Bryobacteraceae bacterium]